MQKVWNRRLRRLRGLRNSIQYLLHLLIFTPADSGSQSHPILYKSDTEGGAVLSGGSAMSSH